MRAAVSPNFDPEQPVTKAAAHKNNMALALPTPIARLCNPFGPASLQ